MCYIQYKHIYKAYGAILPIKGIKSNDGNLLTTCCMQMSEAATKVMSITCHLL